MATILEWAEAHYDVKNLGDWTTLRIWSEQFTEAQWKEVSDPADTVLAPWLREHCQGRVAMRGFWMEVGRDNTLDNVLFVMVEDPIDAMNIKMRWC